MLSDRCLILLFVGYCNASLRTKSGGSPPSFGDWSALVPRIPRSSPMFIQNSPPASDTVRSDSENKELVQFDLPPLEGLVRSVSDNIKPDRRFDLQKNLVRSVSEHKKRVRFNVPENLPPKNTAPNEQTRISKQQTISALQVPVVLGLLLDYVSSTRLVDDDHQVITDIWGTFMSEQLREEFGSFDEFLRITKPFLEVRNLSENRLNQIVRFRNGVNGARRRALENILSESNQELFNSALNLDQYLAFLRYLVNDKSLLVS